MTDTLRGLFFVMLCLFVVAAGSAKAIDQTCIERINAISVREQKRVAVYLGEIKNMKDDPWAPNSESICSSALNRAQQYLKRHQADQSICDIGTSYVDNQAVQLFRNASGTCRQELEERMRRMPPDDQRILMQRVEESLNERR
jgi:hypothetical protein